MARRSFKVSVDQWQPCLLESYREEYVSHKKKSKSFDLRVPGCVNVNDSRLHFHVFSGVVKFFFRTRLGSICLFTRLIESTSNMWKQGNDFL